MLTKNFHNTHQSWTSERKTSFLLWETQVLIRATSEETAGAYCVIETTFQPHYRLVLPHWHAKKSESFYVLDGVLTFTVDDQTFIAQRGSFVLVPPHTVHLYWNSTASPVTFLTISAPGGLDLYLGELATIFAEQPYNAQLAAQIATRYDQFSADELAAHAEPL